MQSVNIRKYLVAFSIFFVSLSFFLTFPSKTSAAALSTASATLSNPRLSYRAGAATGSSGSPTVTIDTSANPDNNTNHLFPIDSVCFTTQYPAGCLGSVNYTVATISASDTFSLSSTLTTSVDTAGYVVSTQSGSMTLTFSISSVIPVNGSVLIQIPVAGSGQNPNDGIPDQGTNNTNDGFDFNKLAGSSVTISAVGGTCTGWGTPSVTPATGTITIAKTGTSCSGAAAITITIPGLVNPTPFIGTHTQGVADNYKIAVFTKDASSGILDSANVGVAPVEGVLVSANIDQTLTFAVTGVAAGQTACGVSLTHSATPYSVPWGTIQATNTLYTAAQSFSISTNAIGGYTVKVEENDQMGKNGIACVGATAGEAQSCIKDTTCNTGSCSETTAGDWTTTTVNGLGYSLDELTRLFNTMSEELLCPSNSPIRRFLKQNRQ